MFHTPPINDPNFDGGQTIRESYQSQVDGSSPELSISSSNGAGSLTKEEIALELDQIVEVPLELARLEDNFVDGLKQPKYLKPLSVMQLSGLFQSFYTKFDKAAFQYLTRAPEALSNNGFLSARETLSSGISGIFNRSRSSSDTARKRSSSLFSTDSTGGVQPLLTPEEINKHLRTTELNNRKVEKLLELCEHDVFQKILEMGTSVPSTSSLKPDKPLRNLKATNLFKNSPEFMEFDRMMWEKMLLLSNMAKCGKLNLMEFLSVPKGPLDEDKLAEHLDRMVYGPLAPYEKLLNVIELHDEMSSSLNHMSNDDFLSTLIYLLIQFPVKHMFINLQFIKLFRYNKKLVEKDLYALTNLDAALTFLQSLTISSLPSETQCQLNEAEEACLQVPICEKVILPETQSAAVSVTPNYSTLPRSNSYKEFEGIRTAFDSSLRNIFGKIRSYTPPSGPSVSTITPDKTSNGISNRSALSIDDSVKKPFSAPDSWRQLGNRNFEDLKMGELKEIFENYKKLLDALDS
ncbi:LAFA_0E10616g1_1 [Lachancea sp. 'fantastica']|nr:LAFA_0E10616g1_1 [Lachancea sp. 'fantastica']